MIENIEQLIEQANQIKSESERVKFIMNYFLISVKYDYAYLIADGYMQGTISELYPFDNTKDIVLNPFKKGKITIPINGEPQEFDDSFCLTTRISKGESKLMDKIIELSQTCNGDIDYFFIKLQELLNEELKLHLDNSEIVNLNISNLISKIKKDMGIGRIIKTNTGQYFITNDIKRVLLSYMVDPNKYFPPKIEDGILKAGVCQHYADYLQELLPKIGISAVRIDGTSELGHAWIAAIIDGNLKSIDLTRAIFIRDGFKGIPPEQKSTDWLIADFEDTFKMQKTRTISAVGYDEGKPISLPQIINGSNYDMASLREIVINQCEKNKEMKISN